MHNGGKDGREIIHNTGSIQFTTTIVVIGTQTINNPDSKDTNCNG